MGWFWADTPTPAAAPASAAASRPSQCPVAHDKMDKMPAGHPPTGAGAGSPPASCPMHRPTIDALTSANPTDSSAPPSSCPVPHGQNESQSMLSRLNPLNYMFHSISQERAPNQSVALPTSRDESSIPKGSGDGNWEYPSPQQMYNALLRKGYTDTDITAVESMVAVHNFLNEGAWAEVVEWERRFSRGLGWGWEVSKRGEENAPMTLRRLEMQVGEPEQPTLIRFQGRPKEMTPKAAAIQMLGRLYPSKFGTEPPFDRHDWYVSRTVNGEQKSIRYVIDYYTGPPEPTGEPVFYLDVRPAITPTGAAERLIRWGGDVWWKASGGETREQSRGKPWWETLSNSK